MHIGKSRYTPLVLLLCLVAAVLGAREPISQPSDGYPREDGFDVLAYRFHVEIGDARDSIEAVAAIDVALFAGAERVELDLVGPPGLDGLGMTVESVARAAIEELTDAPLPPPALGELVWRHEADRLVVELDSPPPSRAVLLIRYRGRARDGLMFGANRHGERTVFADSWPDRARHWLPSVDHPHDKARVGFSVIAPSHYQVVASGTLREETDLPGDRRRSYWQSVEPMATKLMTIGVARFAVGRGGTVAGVPLSFWVYPQDREAGFHDLAPTAEALAWFVERIGPYRYGELASVQSTTRFGGMENAGNIFYAESKITGQGAIEPLVVHEVAHQWFGNAVTEADWHHAWLSEGFATYFTALYLEDRYGVEVLRARMREARDRLIAHRQGAPGSSIVDFDVLEPKALLGAEIYQGGAWLLHMLRWRVGEEAFWQGIRRYYERFAGGNAYTADFERSVEEACRCELGSFFERWLLDEELPEIEGRWWLGRRGGVVIELERSSGTKEDLELELELELELRAADGRAARRTLVLDRPRVRERLDPGFVPVRVVLDPDVTLLARFPEELPSRSPGR
jgi:aminopeptidase N